MDNKKLSPKMVEALGELVFGDAHGRDFAIHPNTKRALISRGLAKVGDWGFTHTLEGERTMMEIHQERCCYTLEDAWEAAQQQDEEFNSARYQQETCTPLELAWDEAHKEDDERFEDAFEEARGDFGLAETPEDLVVIGQSDLDDASKWIATQCYLCKGTSDSDSNPLMPVGQFDLAHQGCLDQAEREAEQDRRDRELAAANGPDMLAACEDPQEDEPVMLTNEQVLKSGRAIKMELEVVKMASGQESRYLEVISKLARVLPRWLVERLIERLVLERCHTCKARPASPRWTKMALTGKYLMPEWVRVCSRTCAA